MHGHALSKCSHGFGKPLAHRCAQARCPLGEDGNRRLVEALGIAQVRACSSTPAAKVGRGRRISSEYALPIPLNRSRIGQRPLERMIFRAESRREGRQVCLEHLEPAAVECTQRRFTSRDMDRSPTRGTGLGEKQRPVGKFEGGENHPGRDLRCRPA